MALAGCMHSSTRVETSTRPMPPQVSPPDPLLSRLSAHWESGPSGAVLVAEVQDTCFEQQRVQLLRKEVKESRASGARWIGVVLTGAASLLGLRDARESEPQERANGYRLAVLAGAGAVAIAVVPVIAEKREESELPPNVRLGETIPVPCGPSRPLQRVSVVIRVDGTEQSSVSDDRGRTLFEGVDSARVDLLLVDDVAVVPSD
jgi:hypothetical protein